MNKKFWSVVCLCGFLNFLIGCTTISPPDTAPVDKSSQSTYLAKKMPEVEIQTTADEYEKGKIISLKGSHLKLLPFPYWNVEPLEILLDDIHTIKLVKKKGGAGKAGVQGFGYTYVIIGILAAAGSKYDEDYEFALLGSLIGGGIGGLIGFLIGGVASATSKSSYKFYKMNPAKKQEALKTIMGLK